jgi:hypothetical protein
VFTVTYTHTHTHTYEYIVVVALGSLNNAVGIATSYGLEGRRVGVRVPVGEKFYLLEVT